MFRRSSDGISVPASLRMNDGAILIGNINCGMSGRLENLLVGDVAFIEFVSKDGQQRFVARHQIASIEPLGIMSPPVLPAASDDVEAYSVLGLKPGDTMDAATAAFQTLLKLYSPDRWSGAGVPFEFSRYAAEKTRQVNMAFTVVKAAMQQRDQSVMSAKAKLPMFGAKTVA